MSRPADRVAVPTNGHHPSLAAEDDEGPSPFELDASHPGSATSPPVVDGRPTATVTPGQMAAGFGIIAALIVLLVGRRRGPRD